MSFRARRPWFRWGSTLVSNHIQDKKPIRSQPHKLYSTKIANKLHSLLSLSTECRMLSKLNEFVFLMFVCIHTHTDTHTHWERTGKIFAMLNGAISRKSLSEKPLRNWRWIIAIFNITSTAVVMLWTSFSFSFNRFLFSFFLHRSLSSFPFFLNLSISVFIFAFAFSILLWIWIRKSHFELVWASFTTLPFPFSSNRTKKKSVLAPNTVCTMAVISLMQLIASIVSQLTVGEMCFNKLFATGFSACIPTSSYFFFLLWLT